MQTIPANQLLAGLTLAETVTIRAVVTDSRKVEPGCVFVCFPRRDGWQRYILRRSGRHRRRSHGRQHARRGSRQKRSPARPCGKVVAQDVEAGTSAAYGTIITLTMDSGEDTTNDAPTVTEEIDPANEEGVVVIEFWSVAVYR